MGDNIVKSVMEETDTDDMEETFPMVCEYQMKLNPKKCVFGVRSGKYLGFMASETRIDANPDNIYFEILHAIIQLHNSKFSILSTIPLDKLINLRVTWICVCMIYNVSCRQTHLASLLDY